MTLLDEIRERIEAELERLHRELSVELPERIRRAVEHGDLREDADYKSALERQAFVQARIGHLSQRMSELSRIEVDALPVDRVGFGSKVVLRDVETGELLELTLAAGDFMDPDSGQVSLASPFGQALLGAREGEEVTVPLPRGERHFRLESLLTLPRQLGVEEE